MMSGAKKTVGMFRTSVPGIGPYCVEFEDGEIISTRSEARQKAIAGMEQLQEERDALQAEVSVLRGVDCEADGDGPCGVCIKCLCKDRDALLEALKHINRLGNACGEQPGFSLRAQSIAQEAIKQAENH